MEETRQPYLQLLPSRDVSLESPVASSARETKLGIAWLGFHPKAVATPLGFVLGVALGVATTLAVTMSAGQRPVAISGPQLHPTMLRAAPLPRTYPKVPAEGVVPQAYLTSPSFNNSCLIPQLALADGPQTFDACGFVIRSTDEVWNMRGDVDAAIDKYFHEDYVDAGSWGRRIIGKKALRDAVLAEMRAFPDIQIHITDCACKGNDLDGYKCAMPDVLTGTNLGPSAYGPATGRYARWTGMVQSVVQRNEKTGQWQYIAEWGVHDEWALIQQLGLDFSRVPHPPVNTEPLHDCNPLAYFHPQPTWDVEDNAMMLAEKEARKAKMRGMRSADRSRV